ncbi:hypothetical protein A5658_03360 [Mycobacterium sp. 1245111.1]|uniref:hypothetical protein n=1 Tax=Mycobacterium sp. 1245111.1 TaxID=1834073 RepID=UPI000801F8DA|nr:hypothetical protein [Mycobacterium sp. 1245111.1]OBK38571.1 hypothetical protein A5658_03360 [Mycobacterium sp. 1245111.1]
MDTIEAEVTDQWIGEVRAEFPELTLTVTAGQTPLSGRGRNYHRRISASIPGIKLLQDRLTMAGLTWTPAS